jgi:hypothetical protein
MNNADNVIKSINRFEVTKNSNGNFKFLYAFEGDQYTHDFYLSESEVRDILYHKDFCPFYVDGFTLVQFTGRTFRIINLNDNPKETYIHFREEELFPFLREVLNMPLETMMDMFKPYQDSLKRAIPKVNETITDDAKEICKLRGISDYLERVRSIAKNSSNGCDDPVELTFMHDHAPKDLYWVISRNNNRIINGGIIYDSNRKTWGIHT